jgi:transposase InsO family protein
MSKRQEFIDALLEGRTPFRQLCAEFGINHKTGYKWRERFRAGGPAALGDGSHAPKQPAHQLARPVREAVLALREQHPTWGARKLRAWLQQRHPTTAWPAASTITLVCKRAGLIPPRRRRDPTHTRWATAALTPPNAPNRVWATDFKGEFRLQSGAYCYPLTVTDGFSRFLLGCEALGSTAVVSAQACFTTLFQTFGLPDVIRSDNGVPFAMPTALGGLSRLSVWWIRLGIRPERIRKGSPTENGAHERMHRTLKAEATRPEATLEAQQRRFTQWQQEYNHERPHEALGQTPPAAHYQPSDRPWPKRLPTIEYPAHADLRCVDANGVISVRGHQFALSSTLAGEYVAVTEAADDRWQVRYGPLQLGHFVAIDDTFEPDLWWFTP